MFALMSHACLVPTGDESVLSSSVPDEVNLGGLQRSMNRAGILLAACASRLSEESLGAIKNYPQRAALYGVVDYCTTARSEILQYLKAEDPNSWSRWISPKWGLQSSVGLIANSLSIVLGVEGGTHSFLHTQMACAHALQQASLDLLSHQVDIAVVAGVNTLEDAVITQKQYEAAGTPVSEGVALMVITRGDSEISLPESSRQSGGRYYGTAHSLIEYLVDARTKD